MASTFLTPEKITEISCCFCFRTNITNCYSLSGSKLSKFSALFSKFLSENVFKELVLSKSSAVCRGCFNKVQNFVLFKDEVTANVSKYIDGLTSSRKRMANFSPSDKDTPPTCIHTSSSTPNADGFLPCTSTPTEQELEKDIASNENCFIHLEHDYSRFAKPPCHPKKPTRESSTASSVRQKERIVCKELFPENSITGYSGAKESTQISKLTILKLISDECKAVCTKRQGEQSVLMTKKSMEYLADEENNLTDQIVTEMKKRTPILFEVINTVLQKDNMDKDSRDDVIGVIYGILMFTRNRELSAIQRLVTVLCIRGRAEDMLLSRLNKMGLSMSTTSKQRLVAECGEHVNSKLTSYLKINPLLKITGDNLDVYIKTGNQSKDVQNTDLHLFASNAISCRASKPDMDTKRPVVTGLLTTDILALKESEMEKIMSSYTILIARILSSMDQFKWMLSVIPQHILHPHSAAMSEKSKVFQLPIQHKNEAKYEDVLDIMDEYEHVLQDAFREAHGNIEMLDKYRVVTGGDQLTKVRFVGAVNLRLMSPNPTKRLEHVQPIICELWHLKQDYLEKCFKAMFKRESLTVEGTLAFYRNVLKKMDVTGKVKGHFQAHSDFFKLMTSMLIQDQAVELFGIDGSDESFPPGIGTSSRSKKLAAIKIIGKSILDELGFNQLEENLSDELNNYSCQLCLRGLHYLQLEDTASEGNLSNVVPNIKMLIPIFYGSSCLSKYMVECIDYVMKVEHYLSPLDKLRVLEGSFVNMKGGLGNNVEADLVQEHSVRNQKTLIRGLGANKTKSSIEAVTAASPVITSICKNFDNNYKIKPKGNRHTRKVSSEDIKCLRTSLRKIQPFKRIEKRSCPHFNGITRQPCGNVNTIKREQDITRIMERLGRGWVYEEGEGEDDGEQDDENNDDNEEDLPEIP